MASTSTRFQRWLLVRGTRKGTGVSTAVSSPSTTIVALEGRTRVKVDGRGVINHHRARALPQCMLPHDVVE